MSDEDIASIWEGYDLLPSSSDAGNDNKQEQAELNAKTQTAVKPSIKQIVIAYTDGGCSGNPGLGAYAYRLEWPDGSVEENTEVSLETTNNREELKAVGAALAKFWEKVGINPSWKIVIHTDSLGAINWLTGVWKRNKNLDLFPNIDALIDQRVSFQHVRGHADNVGNNRVDFLAVSAYQSYQKRQNQP